VNGEEATFDLAGGGPLRGTLTRKVREAGGWLPWPNADRSTAGER
jgi:hypothetical protein